MGYIEKILGNNEQIVYRTHQHLIVLLERIAALLFATIVFTALALAVLVPKDESGNQIRFIVGLIALGSLVLPLYVVVSAWIRGLRGREFISRIWRAALAAILILAVALFMMFSPEFQPIGWLAVLLAAIPFFEAIRLFFDWLNERYLITNRRVMEIRGIVNKHVRDSALEKVNDVELDQSAIGRILGYGTVKIITGSDIGVNNFRRISNPVRFKREMLNAKELLHIDDLPRPVVAAPAPAGPDAPHDNIADLLVELAELRQRGILSEEEFQTKKKELLDRL